MKQDPALLDVPVLLLTGTFEPFDEARARAAGVDDWIVKPFESQALLDKVEELLAKVPEPAVAELPASDLEDDFDIVEDFAEPVGADADMWQEIPETSLGETATETVLGEQSSSHESNTDDFDKPFFAELASSSEAAMPSAAEELADSFESLESPMPDPVPEVGAESLVDEEDLSLAMVPEAATPVESEQSNLWLDEEEADEVLFLDEDDILDEDLMAEDLTAERTADLSFESGTDVFSPEMDSASSLSSSVFDATAVADEPVAEPVKRDGLGFFQNPGLVSKIAAPPKRDGLGFFQNAGLVARLAQPAVVPVEVEEPAPVVEVEEDFPASPENPVAEAPVAEISSVGVSSEEVEQRVAGISEEDLTRIVEKVAASVVERLAGTILERIAWEVVPDLAESMIREEIRHITAKS